MRRSWPPGAPSGSSKFTQSERVILEVWIWKMRRFVFSSGSGNSILRSMRPGRIIAGSRDSMRFVAMMTWPPPLADGSPTQARRGWRTRTRQGVRPPKRDGEVITKRRQQAC